MRITAEAKQRTRERLLEAGRSLFSARGVDGTTARELAAAAGVAAGTIFNYFPSKEALAAEIVAEATEGARETLVARLRSRPAGSLAETLFGLIAAELRALDRYRRFAAEVIASGTNADAMRRAHLATMADMLATHGHADEATPVGTELYWTLYVGVLTFWARDESRRQSETLALLDEAMQLFARGLDDRRT
ncbi:MAG: TetR/AcrR family transcriptional regulator [Phycisphaerales bacterium]|nr:TetR/AcrR family transcriptional regulator [Phycisphaerae bacterium]NNM25501.1 TetR/AcrR family transcriptional regulator [Phycisphaerales bacterium]